MIVKKLELVNFQVIKELNADFSGNVYFITGDNELGKSTVLKAIGALLTGNRDSVLRNGENKGFAKMIVGDDGEEYEVELRFTKANPRGTLTIKQKTTGVRSDNLSMLQSVFGYTDYDAVEFSRWSETAEGRRRQINVVKSLLPIDVRNRIEEIDKNVVQLKEERTDLNREIKTYSAICSAAEKGLNTNDLQKYAEPRDISVLIKEQRLNAQLLEKAKTVRSAREERIKQLEEIPVLLSCAEKEYKEAMRDIDKQRKKAERDYQEILKRFDDNSKVVERSYKDRLAEIENRKNDLETRKNNADKWLAEYDKNDLEKVNIAEQIREAEEHNKMNAKVEDFLSKKKIKEDKVKEVDILEDKINGLLSERETLISTSKLPITGLSFTDEGLELNGVPFIAGKVSDSQIMEVATKLIIASNPTVKVFRIARGESLGEKRLKTIIEIAKKNGFQGFIEEVKRGQEDLIIEEYSEKQ